ncbi:ribosomal protein S18 acetylase RimI-like enzyme [Arthrobacter stackebrandtii]|uniref:Ribosomal protein S18 acetylase RimI-like enzyme n=1 Tax=Arthrobacter stackebrandtii TaxID=272161 RepID=A0ABS4YZ67_9MICC|nr:GNAT family N-acetyltransferase [Arthrobacter stackebrandtii]MBP2414077.1 ribosomal protein S18 acetylase RimI-like enzyme [Arthrobacter stackebrandtii]PYG99377.1 GNAT family N-acetyltransferase [Arthrobacter stackebrandtii]
MTIKEQYLKAYDQQLRTDAETPSAVDVTRMGPLRLVTFAGGRGFITYQDLDGVGGLTAVVNQALEHFRSNPDITEVEWKTRGHDHAPGLHEALIANGFTPDDTESIMVGPLEALCQDAPLPDGVSLRKVAGSDDVRAMSAMADEAFGEAVSTRQADALIARLARNDGMELWVAEVGGRMVSTGRLEPVPNTDFAGIWGGATLEAFRGRGIYRALTAARACSALAQGKTLVHSDSTEFSRPILERSGLLKVSTTTPYNWKR